MIEKNCLENLVGVTKSVTCSGKLFSKHGGLKSSLSVGREAGNDFGKIQKDCKITHYPNLNMFGRMTDDCILLESLQILQNYPKKNDVK